MSSATRLLVVSAHSADFVWRAAGAIATVTANGGSATVVSLSFGERGESGELWKIPGQTVENVKAAGAPKPRRPPRLLGAELVCLDRGDYPLIMDAAALEQLTDLMRELGPTVVLAHAHQDPFNSDHAVASEATIQARQLASGAGVASGFKTITPPALLLFEPHQPELCGFVPTTFLDITPVWEQKLAAMERDGCPGVPAAVLHGAGRPPGEPRAPNLGSRRDQYAEAFQREIPQVVDAL